MPTTIFSATLDTDNSSANTGIRNTMLVTGSSLGQVRVTFQSGSSGSLKVTNASIAVVGAATPPSCTLTPTELLFGGISGFTISLNTTIVSDWLTFSCLSSDTILVDLDVNNPGDLIQNSSAPAGSSGYYKASATDYNQATVSGYTLGLFPGVYSVILIETQAAGPPPALYPTIWM